MDIVTLYTNILHKEGMNVVAKTLEIEDTKTIPTRVIVKFLSLILNLNNFTFNYENYLQMKGYAMGAKCSSTSTWATFTLVHLKMTTSTRSLGIISHATTDLLMRSFSFRTIQKPLLKKLFYSSTRYIHRKDLSVNKANKLP